MVPWGLFCRGLGYTESSGQVNYNIVRSVVKFSGICGGTRTLATACSDTIIKCSSPFTEAVPPRST